MKKLKSDYYQKNSNKFGWGKNFELPEYKIHELLPHISGEKVLDVACGPGHLVDVLNKHGFEAFGIDITPEFINFAKKNKKGDFQVADANSLPFKNQEFDTVILKSILEHLKDDLGALNEALRVGKKVIIIVPHKTPIVLKRRGLLYSHYQDKSHLRNYTEKSIKILINKSTGQLVQIHHIEKLPNQSIFFELFIAPKIIKRILNKLFFIIFKEKPYYLELMAIIKSC